jgi:pyridoxamine 5'-phosphate oxidase
VRVTARLPDRPHIGPRQLAGLRRLYSLAGLDERDLAPDPMTQFGRWFDETAASRALVEPNAMVLSTVSTAGSPSARTVLLKRYDEQGFVFFTNYTSRKATDIAANPAVALLFPWIPLERQVVVTGYAVQVPRAETEAYWRSRPRGAQLGAWASRQSAVAGSRADLDAAMAEVAGRFPASHDVPAPPHWGGIRVTPETVEFWQGRPDRMHDRLRFVRSSTGWAVERVYP